MKLSHQNKFINKGGINLKLSFFSFGILEQGGGFENYMIETATGLVNHHDDVEVEIITTSPKVTEKLQDLLSVYFFKKHDKKNIYRENRKSIENKLGSVKYTNVSTLKELVSNLQQCDVIYTKNEVLELAILKVIGYKKLPPVIVGVHTPIYYPFTPSLSSKLHNILYTGWFYKFLLKGTSGVKTNNLDDKKYMENKFNVENVNVVHHAFNVSKEPIKKNRTDDFNILFVGRLTEQKGIDILIGVIEKLSKNKAFQKMKFRIAGSGEERNENRLNDIAKTHSNIEVLGHIDNAEVHKLYDWADITLIPSKYETLNKVAVETSIAGKISVVSDIAGPREFIIDGHNGFLLEPTVDDFYNKVSELYDMKIKNITKFEQYGSNARKTIQENFNPKQVYGQFYREFLAEKL